MKYEPVNITPELKDQPMFRLSYKEMLLRLRRLIEKGDSPDKEKILTEVDKIYQESLEMFGEK